MSTSTDHMLCTSTAPPVQEDHGPSSSTSLLFPLAAATAGYTAPPPTPMASLPLPLDSSSLAPAPAPPSSNPALENQKSPSVPSAPSKEDLDALAQFLLQQSLHSTPHLLASPTLPRKRRTSPTAAPPAAFRSDMEKEDHVANSRHDNIRIEGLVQTYSYNGGFCEESRSGIQKACQEVGAFYLAVQDAEDALVMLRGQHGPDDESIFEGGLVPLSHLLTSTSQHDQDDVLDLDFLGVDSGVGINASHRDMIARFAKLLFGISKDLLRFLLENLSIETQENIRGHSLKPLLHIHGNGKQELNLDDDVVLLLSYDVDTHGCNRSALFLARLGTQLQTWSQGKYKAPFLNSRCNSDRAGEVCIQFVLIRHY